jgi:hypothetical protein
MKLIFHLSITLILEIADYHQHNMFNYPPAKNASVVLAWGLYLLSIAIIAVFTAYYSASNDEKLPRIIAILISSFTIVACLAAYHLGKQEILAAYPDQHGKESVIYDAESGGDHGEQLSGRNIGIHSDAKEGTQQQKLAALSKSKKDLDEELTQDTRQHQELQSLWTYSTSAQSENAKLYTSGQAQKIYQNATHLAMTRVLGDEERITRKYQRLERIEKDIWALEKDIETTTGLAGVAVGAESMTCKETESVRGDAEQQRKLTALSKEQQKLEKEKEEDRCQHAGLSELCDDARLALRKDELYAGGRNSEALTRAVELAQLRLDEHRHLLKKKRQRGNRLLVDIWALSMTLWKEQECINGDAEQEERKAALEKEKEELESTMEGDEKQHDELIRLHDEACLSYDGIAITDPNWPAMWQVMHLAAVAIDKDVVRRGKKVRWIQHINIDIEELKTDIWGSNMAKERDQDMVCHIKNLE